MIINIILCLTFIYVRLVVIIYLKSERSDGRLRIPIHEYSN